MRMRTGLSAILLAVIVALPSATAATEGTTAGAATFTPNARPHSIAIDWVDAMLLAIEQNPPAPTATTWRMWVVLSSMYDAWSAYHAEAKATASGVDLKRPASEFSAANQALAVDHAAHNALRYVYPAQAPLFDAVLELHGRTPSDSLDPATAAGVGNLAADTVIRGRLTDGANASTFADLPSAVYPEPYGPLADDPNHWQPLRVPTGTLLDERGTPTWSAAEPESYRIQTFLTPHWGSVTPFALESGAQFRPPPPPRLGSDEPYVDALGVRGSADEAFRAQAAEVLAISGALSDEQMVVAEFWADGPHTWTPPGHWVQLAIGVSLRDGHDLERDVCMFMALAGALLDAGIAAWDAKRRYDYVRPATAIPHLYRGQQVHAWAGPGQGTRPIDGADWRPYQSATFVTPPFPEYVSGHSTFSRAAAEVLTGYTGSARMFDGITRLGRDHDGDGLEDLFGQHVAIPGALELEHGPRTTVTLRWETFQEAANEAGISRRYGGIHFQDGDLRGREMGRRIGIQALEHARALWDPSEDLVSRE
jgi:hypothetical protein